MVSHTPGEWVPYKEPTCTENGSKYKECTVCGAVLDDRDVITATGHTWDEGEITTESTCADEGVRTFNCTVEGCESTKTEAIAATGVAQDVK
ncbi:MAG: hypothetical protein IKB34_07825 [Clostridia bacterium]|nr:hypothetical protein [Clostridia bacterium]